MAFFAYEWRQPGSGQGGNRFRNVDCRHGNRSRWLCADMNAASKLLDKVVGRPGTRKLHLLLPHRGTGDGELVRIALDALSFDQMGNIQYHPAVYQSSGS